MLIKLAIILVLGLIFLQDLKSRAVTWVLFPLLAAAFILLRLNNQTWNVLLSSAGVTLAFVSIQVLILTAWFSFRQGKLINITTSLLGWGDILFLVALATGLSLLNFLLFYVSSLVLVCIYGLVNYRTEKQIPLAGLQAVLLAVVLSLCWFYLHVDLSDDTQTIHLLFS